MPLRFPRYSFLGGRTIDAFSLDPIPIDGVQPNDPTSVRFRSIAEILLRGVQRCVAADRESMDEPDQTSNAHEPVIDNLEDSLPEPLAFVSDKPLTVSCLAQGTRTPLTNARAGRIQNRAPKSRIGRLPMVNLLAATLVITVVLAL